MAHDQLYMALVCSIPDPGYRTWTHGSSGLKWAPRAFYAAIRTWRGGGSGQARDGGIKTGIEPCVANSTGRSYSSLKRGLLFIAVVKRISRICMRDVTANAWRFVLVFKRWRARRWSSGFVQTPNECRFIPPGFVRVSGDAWCSAG